MRAGATRSPAPRPQALGAWSLESPVVRGVLGTGLGVLLVLVARASGAYLLTSLLCLGILVALGRSVLVPLGKQQEPGSAERRWRLPFLEQAIGYLLALAWLGPPSLLMLCMGFFLYRFLDVFPPAPVRRVRQRGTRDALILAQLQLGLIALVLLAVLRFTLVPEAWSLA